MVARERLAQRRDAALPGIERLACRERARCRLADEGRRRKIALADPERDQAGAFAAVVRHLDDAAFRRAARLAAQRVDQGGLRREGRLVHARFSVHSEP
jgi:hypothetical protein